MLVAQLDFGDDQAEIVAGEHTDFPGEIAVRDDVAHLLDDGALAELHQLLRFQYRNIILQLQPAQVRGARFDGERCGAVVLDANADRYFPVAGQIGWSKGDARVASFSQSLPRTRNFRSISKLIRSPRPGYDRAPLRTCGPGTSTMHGQTATSRSDAL